MIGPVIRKAVKLILLKQGIKLLNGYLNKKLK